MTVPATLSLPDGLVGLPDLAAFSVEVVEGGPLLELTAVDEPGFRVSVVPAEVISEDLRAALVARDLATDADAVLVILSAHGEPPTLSANLAGPLVVSADGVGRQVIVEDPAFPVRAPIGA
jgi:hypothetical protein